MNNWQPIETAPFDTDVLVYDGVTVWKAYQNEKTSWNPCSFWRLTLNDSGMGCMRLFFGYLSMTSYPHIDMNFDKHFDSVQPSLNEEQKRQLTSILYDAYLEGKNQVQTKLAEKLLALLETNT